MKKQLLTLAFGVLSTLSFGQDFVQASGNTGFTYIGDNRTNAGMTTAGWWPTCDLTGTAGDGGTDESGTNELKFGWGIGVAGKAYNIVELTTPVDLSAAANQKLQVTLRSTDGSGNPNTNTYVLRLEDSGNQSLLEDNTTITVTGTAQVFNVDLGSKLKSGSNLSDVKKVIFVFDACTGTVPVNGALFLSNLKVGSPLAVTSVNSAALNISESKVFPNPSNGLVNIELGLKSASNVKVVLNDLYGREVKVIAEGNYSTLNETFNVSDLAKGMYTVTYILNSAPAKTEILMVK